MDVLLRTVSMALLPIFSFAVFAAPQMPVKKGLFNEVNGGYSRVCFGSSRQFKLDRFPQTLSDDGYFSKHYHFDFARSRISLRDGDKLRRFVYLFRPTDEQPVRSVCIDVRPGEFTFIAQNLGYRSAYPSEDEKRFWRGIAQQGNRLILRGLPEQKTFKFIAGQTYQIIVGEELSNNSVPLVVLKDVTLPTDYLTKCLELRDANTNDTLIKKYYQIANFSIEQAMACDTMIYAQIPEIRLANYRGVPNTEKSFTRKLKKIESKLAKRAELLSVEEPNP